MIKRLISLILLATALFAVTAEAELRPPRVNSPEGIVFKIYKDYAWEAVMAAGYDGLMQQPPQILKQYFDDKLAALILRDRKCSEKGKYAD
jgi:hypothetical protein